MTSSDGSPGTRPSTPTRRDSGPRTAPIKYVMINSNVYHEKDGTFGHTRCFTTEIGEKAWKALKQTA